MKLLFICSENRLRSPTAEAVFSQYEGVQARSAGLGAFAETPVSRPLIEWADLILVMEAHQTEATQSEFGAALGNTQLVSLNIPDQYAYMEPELVNMLESRVPELVNLLAR